MGWMGAQVPGRPEAASHTGFLHILQPVVAWVWGTMAQALGEDLVQTSEGQDDSSSLGSDSELSGPSPYRQADRYGFIGGSSAEPGPGHPPADLIRQREMKWVEMTSHWEKTMSRRYKKVKMQCRKGIPSALRARCWPLLCGAHVCQQNSPGTYQELAEAPGDPQWMETISRDLHRQFPLHEMFVSPQGHGRGSCRYSRPTPCIGLNRATVRPKALWPLCCSCICPQRRPSGAWYRSARSTSPATMGPIWRPCSWMPRCSRLCFDGCSRACTSTCSRWASGLCSTCLSGSCVSSPAPCPSPPCCVSGTPSSARGPAAETQRAGVGSCVPWLLARCSARKHQPPRRGPTVTAPGLSQAAELQEGGRRLAEGRVRYRTEEGQGRPCTE
ncbi:carabin isoform X5 [Lontra canadensis]|uniref:carabin isoform X5 n=1 Tax=Lontra canadensis TaxID=76717 RepID=UPI0013F39ABD|nr:carabin isoform X5 [Lontra canadensis]